MAGPPDAAREHARSRQFRRLESGGAPSSPTALPARRSRPTCLRPRSPIRLAASATTRSHAPLRSGRTPPPRRRARRPLRQPAAGRRRHALAPTPPPPRTGGPETDWIKVDWRRQTPVRLLQQYLRIDTTDATGDELAAALFLATPLEAPASPSTSRPSASTPTSGRCSRATTPRRSCCSPTSTSSRSPTPRSGSTRRSPASSTRPRSSAAASST